jgi:hypothetical protein
VSRGAAGCARHARQRFEACAAAAGARACTATAVCLTCSSVCVAGRHGPVVRPDSAAIFVHAHSTGLRISISRVDNCLPAAAIASAHPATLGPHPLMTASCRSCPLSVLLCSWVRCIAFDPSNDWFCTGSSDRTIKLWETGTGQLKLTLTGHIEQVTGLAVSPRHPYMFSCSLDKEVKCWDLEHNKVRKGQGLKHSNVFCAGFKVVQLAWDLQGKLWHICFHVVCTRGCCAPAVHGTGCRVDRWSCMETRC